MTDSMHIFVAVQWSQSGVFELVALPDDGPAVSVTPWAADAAGLENLKHLLKHQGQQCLIVVDGERDERVLRELVDVSAYDVVNAAPRLQLDAAQGPMLGFYAGNQRALFPRQDAESDARAIRMGWRGSKQAPNKRNPYVRDDIAFHVLAYAKRFHYPGTVLVLEMLEVASFDRFIHEHGARLAALMERHVSGRNGGIIGDYTEWVSENRLALFYAAPAAEELDAHARATLTKALRLLNGFDEQDPAITLHLSYCTYESDDEGWDAQALLETALGLRQARRRLCML